MSSMIYKILRAPELAAFVAAGETEGAPVDRADGFIHFSTPTAGSRDRRPPLRGRGRALARRLRPRRPRPALRWEPSRGGALFPHLYRPLTRADVVWIRPLRLDAGRHVFPDAE
jgi:uncharacterized protein (DUF952 family)